MEVLKRLPVLAVLAALSLLVGCATPTSIRQHSDFAERTQAIKTVAILPPNVEVLEIVFSGDNARLPEREQAVTGELLQQAEDALESKGYQVAALDYARLTAENPELAFEIDQLKQAFRDAGEAMRKESATTENYARFKESVGERAGAVAAPLGVDALLLVDFNGFEKSSGKIAQEMAATVVFALLTGQVAVAQNSGSGVHLGLVEGSSGDVLWTNVAGHTAISGAVVNTALAPMPAH